MKDFNKENEDLTDQELMELIESDKTLSSFIKPEFVMGQVYERFKKLAKLPEPAINLQEAWISVEDMDRLPMVDNEWILGYENGYKKAIPCSFNTKTKKFIDSDGFEITVNYWQPLPAPPLSHLEANEGRG